MFLHFSRVNGHKDAKMLTYNSMVIRQHDKLPKCEICLHIFIALGIAVDDTP